MYSRLALPNCEQTIVYAAVIAILQQDETFQRIYGKNIKTHTGRVEDLQDFEIGQSPAIRLKPSSAGMRWYSPDAMIDDFRILVEIECNTPTLFDVMNLWRVVINAIYPVNDQAKVLANILALQNASDFLGAGEEQYLYNGQKVGAEPGSQPEFSGVSYEGVAGAEGSARIGTKAEIRVPVWLKINP